MLIVRSTPELPVAASPFNVDVAADLRGALVSVEGPALKAGPSGVDTWLVVRPKNRKAR